jgi:hypothetical protein
MHFIKNLPFQADPLPARVVPLEPVWINDFGCAMRPLRLEPRGRIRESFRCSVKPDSIALSGNGARYVGGKIAVILRRQRLFATVRKYNGNQIVPGRPNTEMGFLAVGLGACGQASGNLPFLPRNFRTVQIFARDMRWK